MHKPLNFDVVLDVLGRDLSLLISEYLPFELAFAQFFPRLDPCLERRRAKLTSSESLQFLYYILAEDRFQSEWTFHEALYMRALREKSIERLDALRAVAPSRKSLRVSDLTLPRESIRWILQAKVPVKQYGVLVRIFCTRSDTVRDLLKPLLKVNVSLASFLTCHHVNPKLLRWFFRNWDLISDEKDSHAYCLDNLPSSNIQLWLEMAPIDRSRLQFDIDKADSIELLDLAFKTLCNFHYSERAIEYAIEGDHFDMLDWWEQKEREECLQMRVPRYVYLSAPVSPRVQDWAAQYGVELLYSYRQWRRGDVACKVYA